MGKLTWDDIQKQSDTVLSCGLNKLTTQPIGGLINVTERGFGNYLISLDKIPFYIGEGKELAKRLRQQFKSTTSTFYKSFQKYISDSKLTDPTAIDKFKIQ